MGKPGTTTRRITLGQTGVTLGLLVAVLASAVSVVHSTHRSRQLFNQVQQQQRAEWALEEEWEQLLLEQSTWAAHERVTDVAERRLDMIMPDPAAIRVLP